MSKINRLVARISSYFFKRYVKKSQGRTTDLVIDHVLKGISPEMLDWWWDNINDTERYKLWHPKAHKYFKWEEETNEHVGKIQLVLENIGKVTTKLRIRWDDPNQHPIQSIYKHVLAASMLDDDDNSISWLSHEYETIEDGVKMRSVFRLPEKTPKFFINNVKIHCIEEMDELPKFLPELFQNNI